MSQVTMTANERTLSLILNGSNTYIFDLVGRPLVMAQGGRTLLRGLDGRIKSKSWKGGVDQFDRIIHELNEEEVRHQNNVFYRDMLVADQHFRSGLPIEYQATTNAITGPKDIFSRLLYWTPDELIANAEEFHRIYRPINILPPDQYFSVPLQVVEGCPWNKCTFCNFYRGRKFHVRTMEEITGHIEKIKGFLGAGLRMRRTIFLCDANAMAMPADSFLEVLKLCHEKFPDQVGSDGGIFTFADVPTILSKKQEDLIAFAEQGLRRVYIGMESGSDSLRQLVRKLGTTQDLIEAVNKLKAFHLDVGLIVLLGLGGQEWEATHIQDSVTAIKKMNLNQRDILYFSPFHAAPSVDYGHDRQTENLTLLSKEDMRNQYHAFRKNLGITGAAEGNPIVGVYDIREFVV